MVSNRVASVNVGSSRHAHRIDGVLAQTSLLDFTGSCDVARWKFSAQVFSTFLVAVLRPLFYEQSYSYSTCTVRTRLLQEKVSKLEYTTLGTDHRAARATGH